MSSAASTVSLPMPQHPSADVLVATLGMWLLALAIHAALVMYLWRPRSGDIADTVKPRTWLLLLLAVINPLMPITAIGVFVVAYKSYKDGSQGTPS